MPVKVTVHFKFDSLYNPMNERKRHGGWRERFYLDTDSVTTAIRAARSGAAAGSNGGLIPLRAALLPSSAYIDGYDCQRMVNVAGIGEVGADSAVNTSGVWNGVPANLADVIQSGLRVNLRLQGSSPQTIGYTFRGLPDDRLVTGEYDNDPDYTAAVNRLLRELTLGYGTYVDDRVSPVGVGRGIDTVDTDGVLTYFGAVLAVPAGSLVKVTRTTNEDGRRTGGIYRVGALGPLVNQLTLANWDRGPTKGGTVRGWSRVFALFAPGTGQIVFASRHKTGTPKDYRGANRRNRPTNL